ncbi:hypothetical protein BACI_pCIXO101520 (plasmid) [Bacillus cereus biovar anthracis str. CI]|nr:hypothetical protein BACI_pCIXO101520 [Bacillus cereus biovar anthracis str. CI]EDT64934.1 hypothetical protein BAO_A0160 [Bacillus anthracis str. A0174]
MGYKTKRKHVSRYNNYGSLAFCKTALIVGFMTIKVSIQHTQSIEGYL